MLSIVIPASNEAALIGPCLEALLACEDLRSANVVVVANGCTDDTAAIARGFAHGAAARNWRIEVVELERGHKPSALNAGDSLCPDGARVYLDADVIVEPGLLAEICALLARDGPVYASGRVRVRGGASRISRAYARIYAQMPFFSHGVPGCGLFAVNEAGRERWGTFPDLISDDTFVRLQFAPGERLSARSGYDWPVVQGWTALLRVRRRQEAGVAQLRALEPALFDNDDARPGRLGVLLRAARHDPGGVAIYVAVNALAKLTRRTNGAWSRGR